MNPSDLICPVPKTTSDIVVTAHGGGGRVAQRLLNDIFYPLLRNQSLDERHDAAAIPGQDGLVLSTDTFVVNPWKFPGGNIGSLAVHGTVNDLAMAGAKPLALSAGFVLEEGFSLESLREVVAAMATAAEEAGVPIVAGDTKVVERGKGDGVFINTAGIGRRLSQRAPLPKEVRPGDKVIVSGDIGRHGMAIMACREGLQLDSEIFSDSASVLAPVMDLVEAGAAVHCLRDPTRGGLASVLCEIAGEAGLAVHLDEALIPVEDNVAGACELLGLDPLYVACEGRFVAFVEPEDEGLTLEVMRRHAVSAGARTIGEVRTGKGVFLKTQIGVDRVIDLLSGEQLPRIC